MSHDNLPSQYLDREIGEQRFHLEQMASIAVPETGPAKVLRDSFSVTHIKTTPLVWSHYFSWPDHSRLQSVMVLVEVAGHQECCDCDERVEVTYRVTLPEELD